VEAHIDPMYLCRTY